MLLNLTSYSSEPLDSQIVNQILLRIFEEDKLPGDELDSVNKISRQHHIDKACINRAFKKLEQLGVVHASSKNSFFVNDISTRAIKELIDRNYFRSPNISEYDLIKTELNAAKKIQNGLLPKTLPFNNTIEVSAFTTISDDVGGDFYDFHQIDEQKYVVVIGDASGKGFPAAMLISQIQAIIKSDLSLQRTIAQTVHLINSYMNTYSSAKYFASLFFGLIDLHVGRMLYINAGHNFPIMLDEKGNLSRLKTTGPAVGLMKNADYLETSVNISNNDLLFLFTDGLTERMDKNLNQFGEERIINIIKNNSSESTNEIIDKVNAASSLFADNDSDVDDTTFMAVKIRKVDE